MKQAIVTGATGFIGSKFVEYLISMNINVLALGRKIYDEVAESKKKNLYGSTYIQLDMADISLLSNEIKKCKWDLGSDCVFFNLAWGGEDGLSDLNVQAQLKNAIWSVAALEQAAKVGCSRFIQVGTMEEAFTHRYLELDHHINREYNRHVIYSLAKISAKYALKIKASHMEMDFIYVLHSHVMGPDDDKDSFLQVTLQKLIKGDDLNFSSGHQYFDVISLDDCVLGYYLICQKGRANEEYWVGSGEPRRLREYVERMYNLFPSGKKMQFGSIPYNDVVLSPEDFSISLLREHTGYAPSMTYEQTVTNLYESLQKE